MQVRFLPGAPVTNPDQSKDVWVFSFLPLWERLFNPEASSEVYLNQKYLGVVFFRLVRKSGVSAHQPPTALHISTSSASPERGLMMLWMSYSVPSWSMRSALVMSSR